MKMFYVKAALILAGICALLAIKVTIGSIETYLERIRQDLLISLRNNYNTETTVFINGTQSSEPLCVIETLLSIEPEQFNHSAPVEHYVIAISNTASSVTLHVARDSKNRSEFWVFNPRPFIFKNTVIGTFTSDYFPFSYSSSMPELK